MTRKREQKVVTPQGGVTREGLGELGILRLKKEGVWERGATHTGLRVSILAALWGGARTSGTSTKKSTREGKLDNWKPFSKDE